MASNSGSSGEPECADFDYGPHWYGSYYMIFLWLQVIVLFVGLFGNLLSAVVLTLFKGVRGHVFNSLLAIFSTVASIYTTIRMPEIFGNHFVGIQNVKAYAYAQVYSIWPLLIFTQLSLLCLTLAMTIDRYLATNYPHVNHSRGASKRLLMYVVPTFLLSGIFAIIEATRYKIVEKEDEDYPERGTRVSIEFRDGVQPSTAGISLTLILYFLELLPILPIPYLMVMILLKTQRNHRQRIRDMAKARQDGEDKMLANPDAGQNQMEVDAQQKEDELAKVLIVFLIIFFICIVPTILHGTVDVVYWECAGLNPLVYHFEHVYKVMKAIYYSSVLFVCLPTHKAFRRAFCCRCC